MIVSFPRPIQDKLLSMALTMFSSTCMGRIEEVADCWFEWDPVKEDICVHLNIRMKNGEVFDTNARIPMYSVSKLQPKVHMSRLSLPDWL